MSFTHYLGYQAFFILIIGFILYRITQQSDYASGEYVHKMRKIFLFGFVGWILAFLRIILIQIIQVVLLINAGVDLTDPEAITNAAIVQSYAFNMIGPILAGIFEEIVRFFLLMKVIGMALNKVDRKYIPLIFGTGWALSEIMLITIGIIAPPEIALLGLAISAYERIIAMILHVSLTYIVLYGKFDNKKSMWLAVIIHIIIDGLLVVLLLELTLDGLTAALVIEGILTLSVALLVVFTRYYVKNKEVFLSDSSNKYLYDTVQ